MAAEGTVTITVRAGPETQEKLTRLKVARANQTGKWLSNQAIFVEALELLLAQVQSNSAPKTKLP